MAGRVVYFSGDFVPERDANVSIFDCALMYGDMAFEMTRTFGGQPFKLREHLDRLYGSLRLLEIDCGLSQEEMEEQTLLTLEKNRATEEEGMDWWVMHDVSRGPLPVYGSLWPEGTRPTVTISTWPLITHMGTFSDKYDHGVDIVVPAQQALPAHLVDAKAKTRSRMHYKMAELQGQRIGEGAWPVLFDPDGFMAEGPGWNIFLVKDGTIFTPEPRNILQGVSRGTVFELAEQEGIPMVEANLGRYEALQADEIFCTSTSYCIVHGRSFEGQVVGDGQRGPVVERLTEAWRQRVGVDMVAQAREYAEALPGWLEQAVAATKAAVATT